MPETECTYQERQEKRTRIVIADPYDLTRAGLQELLEVESDYEVVGLARNGEEAVFLCRRFHPDLVLLEARMPVLDGFAAAARINKASSHTRVIIITMDDPRDYLREAAKERAFGYLTKDASMHEVLTVVQQVLSGET